MLVRHRTVSLSMSRWSLLRKYQTIPTLVSCSQGASHCFLYNNDINIWDGPVKRKYFYCHEKIRTDCHTLCLPGGLTRHFLIQTLDIFLPPSPPSLPSSLQYSRAFCCFRQLKQFVKFSHHGDTIRRWKHQTTNRYCAVFWTVLYCNQPEVCITWWYRYFPFILKTALHSSQPVGGLRKSESACNQI